VSRNAESMSSPPSSSAALQLDMCLRRTRCLTSVVACA
jgi:hypothetical protein